MSVLCFELFKRFIAFESGVIRQEILTFITEIVFPIMTHEEKKAFTFRIIEEFLSQVHNNISQKSILEALNTIGIPEGELISFLLTKLDINVATS